MPHVFRKTSNNSKSRHKEFSKDYVKVEIFFGIRILTSIVSNLEVEELMLFMALLSSSMSRHGRLIRPRTHNCDMHAHKQKDMLIFFHKKKDAV